MGVSRSAAFSAARAAAFPVTGHGRSYPSWLAEFAPWATAAFGAEPGQNWLNGAVVPDASLFSVTRASSIHLPDGDGVYSAIGANLVPRNGLGVLGNGARTNLCNRKNPTVAQLATSSGVTDAAGYAGQPNSIAIDTAGTRFAHLAPTLASSTAFTAALLIYTEDGNPPAFGNASPLHADNTFAIVVNGVQLAPTTYSVKQVRASVWRVSVSGTSGSTNSLFGVVRTSANQARAFRDTGYQLYTGSVLSEALIPGSLDTGGATLNASDIQLSGVPTGPFRFQFDHDLRALSPSARQTLAVWGADTNNAVKLVYDTDSKYKLILRKSSTDVVTLETSAAASTGIKRVAGNVEPGDYALSATGLAGDDSSSSETLPTLTHWRAGSDYSNALPLETYLKNGAVGAAA